jgi:dTDP-L-rhamnose 4-epimerase
MRTLVTGGAGFIGSHLVQRLLRDGREVVVVDSLEGQVHGDELPESVAGGVTFHRGDVGDADVLRAALEGVEEIVHLGALVGVGQSMYEIERYVRRNSLSTAAFLEAVVAMPTRPRRLVVASSMSIYGEGQYVCENHGRVAPVPRPEHQLLARDWECRCASCGAELSPTGTGEDKPLIPTSVYAITKRDHEELCLVVGRAYGIPTVALRFFNVYGPGQALSNPYTGVAAIFGSRLLNGKPPIIFEDGEQSRDFIHVSDIVEGITLALGSDEAVDHPINLGTGRPTTINQMADAIAAGLGSDVEPERVEQYRAGDIRHCYADVTRAEKLLGFRAAVDLDRGMADLIDWVRAQEAVDRVDEATGELLARGLAR